MDSSFSKVVSRAAGCAVTTEPLPPFLETLRIDDLRVGSGSVDLSLARRGLEVSVDVARSSGHVTVTVVH